MSKNYILENGRVLESEKLTKGQKENKGGLFYTGFSYSDDCDVNIFNADAGQSARLMQMVLEKRKKLPTWLIILLVGGAVLFSIVFFVILGQVITKYLDGNDTSTKIESNEVIDNAVFNANTSDTIKTNTSDTIKTNTSDTIKTNTSDNKFLKNTSDVGQGGYADNVGNDSNVNVNNNGSDVLYSGYTQPDYNFDKLKADYTIEELNLIIDKKNRIIEELEKGKNTLKNDIQNLKNKNSVLSDTIKTYEDKKIYFDLGRELDSICKTNKKVEPVCKSLYYDLLKNE